MIEITTSDADVLVIKLDESSETVELSRWVCDKIHNKIEVYNAFGSRIFSSQAPFLLNGMETIDLSAVRTAVGSNW